MLEWINTCMHSLVYIIILFLIGDKTFIQKLNKFMMVNILIKKKYIKNLI